MHTSAKIKYWIKQALSTVLGYCCVIYKQHFSVVAKSTTTKL